LELYYQNLLKLVNSLKAHFFFVGLNICKLSVDQKSPSSLCNVVSSEQ